MADKQIFDSCIFYNGTFGGVVVLEHTLFVTYKVPEYRKNDIISELPETDAKGLNQSGVYLLFNINDDGQQEVYVGQGGERENGTGVLSRICEEHQNCAEWQYALMFVSRTANQYNPADINYFERELYDFAKKAERYKVLNKKRPSGYNPPTARKFQLDNYLELIKLATGILGFNVFAPTMKPKPKDNGRQGTAPGEKRQKPPFKFSLCGIKVGDFITWRDDPKKTFKVASDNTILYNGEERSLSAVAKEKLHSKYAVNGVLYFKYNGTRLDILRKQLGN